MARPLAFAGIAAVAVAAALTTWLHAVPPSSGLDPVRGTLSRYVLYDNGWLFQVAVLALCAGSLAILGALVASRLVPARSPATAAMLLFSLSLPALVLFPKTAGRGGPDGDIHRAISVVTFLSLPLAAMLAARAWRRHERWRTHALVVTGWAVAALLCFAPVPIAFLLEPFTGVRWFRAVPLGALERALVFAEVATIVALAWWTTKVRLTGGLSPAVRGWRRRDRPLKSSASAGHEPTEAASTQGRV